MNIDDWKSQIKRGTLEFCILLMIKQRPSYGYEIISTLEKYPILAAKENTIYPLLRRLMKEDYVSSSWQESAATQAANERRLCFVLMAGKCRGLAAEKVLFRYR